MEENDLDKLMEFRNKVMFEHSLGFVSKEDANFLIEKTVDPFTEQKAEKKNFISNALQEISDWVEITDSPTIVAAKMLSRLVFKAENENLSGEQIEEATKEIIETELRAIDPNFTMANLEFTAKEIGLSVEETLKLLKKKVK